MIFLQNVPLNEDVLCVDSMVLFEEIEKKAIPRANRSSPRKSLKLVEIYKRLTGSTPVEAHNAEADTITMLLCATVVKDEFVNKADTKAVPFKTIGTQF